MLQQGKLNKISSFNGNSFNDKNDSINIVIKKTPKSLVFIFKYLKFFIILEILIVFVAGYFFLVGPKLGQLSTSLKILKNKQDELETLKNYQSQSKDLQEVYDKIKNSKGSELGALKNILPQEKDLPELMAQIEALTLSENLVLGNISINNSASSQSQRQANANSQEKVNQNIKDDLIKEVEVSVSVLGGDGTYEKVKKLLDAMETHIRLIDISSFSFDEKMTSYSIIFKTYYLKSDEK